MCRLKRAQARCSKRATGKMRFEFALCFKVRSRRSERGAERRNDFKRKPANMGITADFSTERSSTGPTERRTPFGPPLKGGPRGESPAPSPAGGRSADAAKAEKAAKAEWVRQNLPTCTAFAQAMRAVFPDCRMTYASEYGHTIGTPDVAAFSIGGDDLVAHPVRVKP